MNTGIRPYYKYFILIISIFTINLQAKSQSESLATGSFIINMGATNPNTIGNGLKPYGLIYDLIRNNNVPVKWVIGAGKIKDGVDFTYNGVQYRGGTFIIPAQYRSAAVNAKITAWQGQGVVGITTTSPLTVNVTQTLNAAPRWTLDAANGTIAEGYLINAGITNTAFPGAYNWKSVSTLDPCDDFFVMPHADPTWATHSNLFNWNLNSLGSIWAACHAVSALENCINPANTTQQMNFLSTRTAAVAPTPWPNNSLTLWGSHTDGSVPYTHQLFDDPVAQYLGTTDAAQVNGSEQIYLPKQGLAPNNTRWRPGAKIIAYDPTQANVTTPDLANGNIAALIVYGRAFDNPGRGYVMYEAGHSHNRGSAADVAAQRAFFNFSFFQVQPKAPNITVTGLTSGQNINSGTVTNVSVSATSPLIGVNFSYLWTSSCGGTFANATSATTTFTAPTVAGPTPCVLTCRVSDNCGRTSFQSFPVVILSGPQPPVPAPDNASISVTCGTGTPVTVNVLTNDADPGGLPLTLTNVTGAVNGSVSFTAGGNVTFTPNANFTGPLILTYTVCNNATPVPLCANSTLTITATGGSTPAAANDAFTIAEDAIGTFNVLANDAGGLTVIGITSGPANGRVSINTDNTITYVPNADFGGPTDNFTYRVTNGSGGYNTATVTVTVTNDACNGGTFQNGYPASGGTLTFTPAADTYLREDQTGRNYGSCATLGVDLETTRRLRSLLKFDLTSIPAGATITSVSLMMQATAVQNNTAFTIDAHSISSDWNEGTLCDANGNSNWNNRNASAWTTAGGDYSGTILSSVAVSTTGSYTWPSGANFISAVQGWVNTPANNNGLLLKFNTEGGGNQAKTFSSSTGTSAPVLTVTYTTSNGMGNVAASLQDDNILYSPDTKNYGACNFSDIGGVTNIGRLASYFTFSGIPAGSTITSAALSMKLQSNANNTQAISVYRLTRAFTEGAGACGGSANGVPSNWTTASAGNPWTTAGGDFTGNPGSTAYASTTVNNGTASGTAFNWNVTSLVQQWQDGTFSNFGFLLKGPETGGGNPYINFHSNDATNSVDRPSLNIFYSAPAICSAIPTRAPMAMPDTASTANGVAVIIATATNDFFPVAGARTYTIVTPPASGIASINATTGEITYTPNTTFNGVRSLTYQVTHTGSGLSDIATVYINITNGQIDAVNDDPLPGANSGVVQTINVRTNDTDPEGAVPTATVSIATAPLHGTATVNGSGNIVYTPNAGFTGKDTLFYNLCEPAPSCGSPLCDIARLIVTVLNRVPTATPDTKTILPCYANTINLVGNDTDPENGSLTVTNLSALSNPAAGTLVNNNDGTVTFTPAIGFTGVVTFTYTVTDNGVTPLVSAPALVTITVLNPVNTPPVAVNDLENTNMDQKLYANVRDNDSDPENNPLTIPTITIAPLHGTAVVNPLNGQIEYTPNPGFYGTDSIRYRICDIPVIIVATCTSGPDLCDTATLIITVDAPNTVIAINDENSTWINTPVSGGTLGNDFDPQGDNPIAFNGFIIGGTSYTSGTIAISGFDMNGAPVPNAGNITINANGTYTFTPALNFTGVVNVPYSIQDNNINTAVDTANLRITVNPLPGVANSIIANNDENRVFGGATVSNTLFVNDRDPQGNPFTVTGYIYDTNGDGTPDGTGTVGAPVMVGGVTSSGAPVSNAGTLTINANGTYTFTPAADFTGSVDVPYTICDNVVPPACATAILHIDVMVDPNGPLNDPPQPGDDFAYTNINTPVTSTFITNDSDPNNDPVSVNGITINTGGPATPIGSLVTTAKGGTVQYFANGTFTYTPPAGYVGPDSVEYEICDVTAVAPQPLCNKAFLHLLVGVNNTTDAINDENSTWQDVNVSGNVLNNDFDAEGHTQTFGSFLTQNQSGDISSGAVLGGVDKTGVPIANAGTLTFDANGNFTFDPHPAFTGTVTVPYRLCDNGNPSKCDTAFLTITVDPLPTTGLNSVIANNDENISYGAAVGGSLFVNDRDPQNDAFTVTSFVGGTVGAPGTVAGIDLNGNAVANAGTLTINANGTYTFTPTPGFVGSINVPYTITDAFGATSTAILHIDVLKDPNGILNDPPIAGDDFGYTTINKPVTGTFISNDSDPNGDPVSYMGVTIIPAGPATPIGAPVATAQGGTIQFYANGTYLYTPPAGYVGPDRLPYTICDVTVVAPQPLCADATIHLLVGPGINIAGRVWDDANGNVNINGGENQTNAGNTLYVNLVDGLGNVVATTPVAVDGTYSFTNVNPGANYSLQLTINQGTVGNAAPAVVLPAGWDNTGENRNGNIDGGTPGVIDTRNFGFTNTINFDFGIEQLPNTNNHTTTITQPNVGTVVVLNGGANPPVLSGQDPEDCNAGCTLATRSVIIDAVPANSDLYYNGILVTNGQQINNFDPDLLEIRMTAATIGSVSTFFQYSYVDLAGKKDPTPATYTLNWLNPLPITLASFTGIANKCDAVLQWKTSQEINADKFVVEQSNNGLNFTTVAEVKSANSENGRAYQLSISQPNSIKYYRLKMLDKDGSFRYSPIITVRTSCTSADYMTVYPNPVSTNLTVSFQTAYKGHATMQIVNSVGQQMGSQKIQITSTVNTFNLDMSHFVPGLYMLSLVNESGEKIGEVQKVIKN
jgi:hypothetical protein